MTGLARVTRLLLSPFGVALWLAALPGALAAGETVLALAEVERLALDQDPLVRGFEAQSAAYGEQAIADRQLPDPQLKFGIQDVPTDTFSRTEDDFTMLVIGAQQSFPRGRTLRYKSEQMLAMSKGETAKAALQRLLVLQAVRNAYIELHYQGRAEGILRKNRALFEELLAITEKQYAAGRDNQHDVIRAQLELSLLDDRLTQTVSDREQALAELSKWITLAAAQRPLPDELPPLPELPGKESLAARLAQHPSIQVENEMVAAGEKMTAMAKEQYKPGWMLDISYGNRQDVGGEDLSDFVSAMVTVDLPLFPRNRQDRALAASQKEVTAATYNRADRLRELTRMLEAEQAKYNRLQDRLELYEKRAQVEAAQTTEATLAAYESARAAFIDMLRARMTELDTELTVLRLKVDRAKVQANLLYLGGETP